MSQRSLNNNGSDNLNGTNLREEIVKAIKEEERIN